MFILARLGVTSRPIYVNVDSPNLGFPYFNFLGGYQLKKHLVCAADPPVSPSPWQHKTQLDHQESSKATPGSNSKQVFLSKSIFLLQFSRSA